MLRLKPDDPDDAIHHFPDTTQGVDALREIDWDN